MAASSTQRRAERCCSMAGTPLAKEMSTPKPIAPSSFADIFLVQQGWGFAPSTEVFDTNLAIFGQKKVWPLPN